MSPLKFVISVHLTKVTKRLLALSTLLATEDEDRVPLFIGKRSLLVAH
jgi:hypothetical protein